jgi:hypothetical protein
LTCPCNRNLVQAIALQSILSILNSTKSTDIPAIISDLNSQEQVRSRALLSLRRDPANREPEQVTLMKYLYKAMENLGETSGNVVLGWHEKVGPRSVGSALSTTLTGPSLPLLSSLAIHFNSSSSLPERDASSAS